MRKCRYCHCRLWPWQSYSWDKTEQTHDYAILHRMNYEDDAHIHDGCYFEAELKNASISLERAMFNQKLPRWVGKVYVKTG